MSKADIFDAYIASTNSLRDVVWLVGAAALSMVAIAVTADRRPVDPISKLSSIAPVEAPIAAPPADPDEPLEQAPDPDLASEIVRPEPETVIVPQPVERIPSAPGFITLFGLQPNLAAWHLSSHGNGNSFQANDWDEGSVQFDQDGLALVVLDGRPGGQNWTSGEVQSKALYGYGRYEVMMRPVAQSGLVSAFFTYTGPYFGDPHDEIDIEFIGRDTRTLEVNYFRNGEVGGFAKIPLSFDAADRLHVYAFDWRPDRISWYVDNELVYQTPANDTGIPRTPGRIFMNLWTGRGANLHSWHGAPQFDIGARAEYACVSFTPIDETGRTCSDLFVEVPGLFERIARRFLPSLLGFRQPITD